MLHSTRSPTRPTNHLFRPRPASDLRGRRRDGAPPSSGRAVRRYPGTAAVRPDAGCPVSPAMQVILDALSPLPAAVSNARYDVLRWNDACAALFPGLTRPDAPLRNTLWASVTVPERCNAFVNCAEQLPLMVAPRGHGPAAGRAGPAGQLRVRSPCGGPLSRPGRGPNAEGTAPRGGPFLLWSYGELNPGPLACHASALPTELQPRAVHLSCVELSCVELRGIEPRTSCMPCKRSTN